MSGDFEGFVGGDGVGFGCRPIAFGLVASFADDLVSAGVSVFGVCVDVVYFCTVWSV